MPQWDIASATRVGDMYLSLVNDFRDAPVPPGSRATTSSSTSTTRASMKRANRG